MEPREDAEPTVWPPWQRILFRFFFLYLVLYIAPWTWLYRVPGVATVSGLWWRLQNWAVQGSNANIFHVRDSLVTPNGSGDTSWNWTQLWLFLSLAAIGCLIWSVLDRRRLAYPRLGYLLRTVTRYFIAAAAITYGIIKIFALQMPFPTHSQLATPLGDLLPMRFSWLFIGYSAKYQIFSGLMETVAGLLLLYRRTVTLGLLMAAGAFLNVVMINMSYDVPVKLYASHLLFACVFLLLWDARRLFTFLVLNRAAPGTKAYEPVFAPGWQRMTAVGLKILLVGHILIMPLQSSWRRYQSVINRPAAEPFRTGIYDVRAFVLNGDTIASGSDDDRRWSNVIFDSESAGSIGTTDTLYWQRYRRGYFRYRADTENGTLAMWRNSAAFDSTYLYTARYEMPDTNTIRLWLATRDDSVHVELARNDRHFQLTERQFHWLSEYNR